MNNLNRKLIHLAVPIFFIHFLEELYFSFYKLDTFILFLAKYVGLDVYILYILIQLILFLFLAIILILIIMHKNIEYGSFIIGILLVFEASHIIPAIISKSYYPGLFSGCLLFILGIWYWYKFIKIKMVEQ